MTDRKKLEAAIAYYKKNYPLGDFSRDWISEFVAVFEAAEAHLASLPKPMWKVREWPNGGSACVFYEWPSQHIALNEAERCLSAGARKVEIEAP